MQGHRETEAYNKRWGRERVENVTLRSPGTNEQEKKVQNAHQLIEIATIFLQTLLKESKTEIKKNWWRFKQQLNFPFLGEKISKVKPLSRDSLENFVFYCAILW